MDDAHLMPFTAKQPFLPPAHQADFSVPLYHILQKNATAKRNRPPSFSDNGRFLSLIGKAHATNSAAHAGALTLNQARVTLPERRQREQT
jgi:hypothetical protein